MFKVSARTVLELGSELISSDAIAFYELIKNGVDAGTKDGVTIKFKVVLARRDYLELRHTVNRLRNMPDNGNHAEDEFDFEEALAELLDETRARLFSDAGKLYDRAIEFLEDIDDLDEYDAALEEIDALNQVTVSDTGSGMSLEQLETVFLVLGTKSRKEEVDTAFEDGVSEAPYLGEKGIGRLSAMRLGDRLTVRTAREEDETFNILDIDWTDFEDPQKMIEDVTIEPRVGGEKPQPDYSGTDIRVRRLKANWDRNRVERLAVDDFSLLANPIGKPKRHRIAIFWNGERINFARLDKNFLSHAHATLKGEYKIRDGSPELTLRMELVNLGFEHPVEHQIETLKFDDLLAALVGLRQKRSRENKRDVNAAALTDVGPFNFELYWFNRATLRKGRSTGDYQALRKLLDQWMGVRLYRDGFRVYPYGTEDDDWLELDRTALRAKGYALNRIQFVGQVDIGRFSNPHLIDQTNREGLRHTPEEAVLKEAIQLAVDRLRDEMKRVENAFKKNKPRVPTDPTRTKALEQRMKKAIRALARSADEDQREIVAEFEEMREEFSRYAAEARERILELEQDTDQMVAMAGVGLMVEVVAHELARSAEDALDTLNKLQRKNVPEEVRSRLESLRASMKAISKRLRILDPLSVSGRQRKEAFELDELVRDLLSAHEAQFDRHHVKLETHFPDRPVALKAVKGMVAQVIENLVSNSVYWMDIERERKLGFKPLLTIAVEDNPPRVRVTDNGPGISPEYAERVFDLFFSLKDKSRRRGLGLFIAREAAEHNGGALVIDTEIVNREGRYTTFDYRVIGSDE
ncbi:RstB [Aurantiacibacter xanthus]|uniref:histidine kinase n=1 Tax=Aurantiacibacter xanthus TaxID=1784712 RepID=A0A3A1P5X9_9SPHN|nr:sensor histidine kinase [Aurantiacibacter xanthus]RIV86956.1 RstB [Aurantiacibacter xanthus]|tara:strand:+ start:587 stop:3007 length:2421 start_codon:yes stop_codon:yes gene_type:complete